MTSYKLILILLFSANYSFAQSEFSEIQQENLAQAELMLSKIKNKLNIESTTFRTYEYLESNVFKYTKILNNTEVELIFDLNKNIISYSNKTDDRVYKTGKLFLTKKITNNQKTSKYELPFFETIYSDSTNVQQKAGCSGLRALLNRVMDAVEDAIASGASESLISSLFSALVSILSDLITCMVQ